MFSFVNLWELSNHTLFDDINIAEGINKDILVNSIFDECSEFEPLTIDVNMMKFKINNFFMKYYDNFRRLYEYTQLEYNPIDNYNKNSVITITDDGNNNVNRGNEDFKSTFDSNEYQKSGKYTTDEYSEHINKNITNEHTYGNIGVTTSTQMLEQDTTYWMKNNMYVLIAKKFTEELCITVAD